MILNEKFSLFLEKSINGVYVILSDRLRTPVDEGVAIFEFTKNGEFKIIKGQSSNYVADLFTLDGAGAVRCDVDGPNKFIKIGYNSESYTILLTDDVGLKLVKCPSGSILLQAINVAGFDLAGGVLLNFYTNGRIDRVIGVCVSPFKVSKNGQLMLPEKRIFGHEASRNGNTITIGCLRLEIGFVRNVLKILETNFVIEAIINMAGYKLIVGPDTLKLEDDDDGYEISRVITCKTLNEILGDS